MDMVRPASFDLQRRGRVSVSDTLLTVPTFWESLLGGSCGRQRFCTKLLW